MQNPNYLVLFLNDFVDFWSSIHEFEMCKNDIFQHKICCYLKKNEGMKQIDQIMYFSK